VTSPDGNYRYNSPPNWPTPAEGWTPPPGWQSDPAWGPAPEGWQFWLPLGQAVPSPPGGFSSTSLSAAGLDAQEGAAPPLLSGEQLSRGQHHSHPQILQQLRAAKETKPARCLECGYDGLMPIIKKREPWYSKWWGLLIIVGFLFILGANGGVVLGLVVGGIAAGIGALNTKFTVNCPNCRSRLAVR